MCPECISKIKSLSDILPNDERIAHLGSVTREEAKKIMESANVFVLPSRGEGFPISLIEAMRGRCIPVISDAKHGALDIIENGVNGYVTKQGDYLDLASCIENIITEHKSLSRVYEAAYQTYLQNLTMSVWTEKMSSILMSENCHSPRKTYSNNKVGVLSSLLRNRIYLMIFRYVFLSCFAYSPSYVAISRSMRTRYACSMRKGELIYALILPFSIWIL